MGEFEYKYGCNKCGRYVEGRFKSGFGDIGKFEDKDIHMDLEKICICKNKKE